MKGVYAVSNGQCGRELKGSVVSSVHCGEMYLHLNMHALLTMLLADGSCSDSAFVSAQCTTAC